MLPTLQRPKTRSSYRTIRVSVRDLTRRQVSEWRDLQQRALEPNPFLSPLLVLPALEHLTSRCDVDAILIYRQTNGRDELVGLGLFEFCWASRILPMPHVRAYKTRGNAFLTGLLVEPECAEDVLTEFFEFTSRQESHWQHIEFDLRSMAGRFSRLFDRVAVRFGKTWHGRTFERPAFYPQTPDSCNPDVYLSKNRRKKYRRSTRTLQALGQTEFRVIRAASELSSAADTFLQLEDQGWKQDGGQSFRSSPGSERFFREMTDSFAREDQIIFTELRLNDRAIGSTINLIAGNQGFALKSGWAVDLERLGIGALQEIELVKHAPEFLSDLTFVDGCTGGNSWLKSLWPSARLVGSGVFTGSRLAHRVARLASRDVSSAENNEFRQIHHGQTQQRERT